MTDDRPGAGRGHGSLERVTVNLTPRSSKALEQTVDLTGDSKTDTINRALQVYAFLEEIMQAGGSIYVRQSADSELERLRIF
ncbi:hypothetical protein [Streptoalloteichus tenebrarius]|uniref:hypothetical protein n=1 Tax=Streptoalloteichus tenebrarius (strain ATCC 17920 / DSM 40477 / JCM 4838 / CBS 697.72 / NBRC 16177 / NCIMB 11028 / NRRL B-12390 / A12253. 1 / ISP 5477) TaxID=1933 RepID=UPI0020A46E4E|nr:hypothetical protein [Streptoalloteichus tenebrarius]BFF02876.1 hypothetical protein GCM10020241_45510 [Streptoalloteichus tenebrarius]